jgi:putative component of membrane protein insertase Oxa1/YidC/SpoIIIJ protein YidD
LTFRRPENLGKIGIIHKYVSRVMICFAHFYLVGRKWLTIGLIIFPFLIRLINFYVEGGMFYGLLLTPTLSLGGILLLNFLAEWTRAFILNKYTNLPKLMMILGSGLSTAQCLAIILLYRVVFGYTATIMIIPIIISLSPLLPVLTRLSPQEINYQNRNQINHTFALLTKSILKNIESLLHSLILDNANEFALSKKFDVSYLKDFTRLLDKLWEAIDSLPEDKLREIASKLTILEFNLKLASPYQQNILIGNLVLDLNEFANQAGLPEALPLARRSSQTLSVLTKFAIKLIYSYRNDMGKKSNRICAYYPSCSRYAELSLLRFGLLKGSLVAIQRMCRCYPGSPGGYDPVPG